MQVGSAPFLFMNCVAEISNLGYVGKIIFTGANVKMILNVADLSIKERYKTMIGAILPRPIAWVSTMDKAGNLNAAPFSYFNAACTNPMTLVFFAGYSGAKEGKKDTVRNIQETEEFVINLTNEDTAEAMNLTAVVLPHGESEFEYAGITPAASEFVKVPRIAEAPIAYECKLQRLITISDQPGGGYAIFGEVQGVYLHDDVYQDGYVVLDALKPIGRLAGSSYARVTDTFDLERPPTPPAK